jgi:hypothetical protein
MKIHEDMAGVGLVDVASVTIHLADISAWGTVNQIFQEYFRPAFPPRAVVGVPLGDLYLARRAPKPTYTLREHLARVGAAVEV